MLGHMLSTWKLEILGTIENKEQDIFTEWLQINKNCGQKWSIAILLKITPLAAVTNKKLTEFLLSKILFYQYAEEFYDKWSKDYQKSRLKASENDTGWNELYGLLDIVKDKAKMAIKVLVSDYWEKGEKFDDKSKFNISAMKICCM